VRGTNSSGSAFDRHVIFDMRVFALRTDGIRLLPPEPKIDETRLDARMNDVHRLIVNEIPRLRRYARSLTRDNSSADDLLQDCLARALGKLHLWQEDTNLQGWLMTILHNQHVNHVRRRVRMGITVDLDTVPYLSCPADQDKGLELRDLECALGQLPEVQRAAINLVGRNGMGYAAASVVLGIPIGTVRSRLSRGRNALRHLLAPEPDGPVGQAAVMARPTIDTLSLAAAN
jgi:RNA polymerase sigma-70 factor (ECF subfamily)